MYITESRDIRSNVTVCVCVGGGSMQRNLFKTCLCCREMQEAGAFGKIVRYYNTGHIPEDRISPQGHAFKTTQTLNYLSIKTNLLLWLHNLNREVDKLTRWL